jgi:hypothetical protein
MELLLAKEHVYVRSHDKKGCFEIIVGKSISSFLRAAVYG